VQNYRIRVLDADKFAQTEKLRDECSAFTDKIQSLSGVVKTLVDAVDQQVHPPYEPYDSTMTKPSLGVVVVSDSCLKKMRSTQVT